MGGGGGSQAQTLWRRESALKAAHVGTPAILSIRRQENVRDDESACRAHQPDSPQDSSQKSPITHHPPPTAHHPPPTTHHPSPTSPHTLKYQEAPSPPTHTRPPSPPLLHVRIFAEALCHLLLLLQKRRRRSRQHPSLQRPQHKFRLQVHNFSPRLLFVLC